MSSNFPENGGGQENKTEGFSVDEVFRLIAELKISIDELRQSINNAIERSRTSDRNFDGRLQKVEGAIEAAEAKRHEDSNRLTVAIDRCYQSVEKADAARLELRETTQHLRHIVAILEKINVGRNSSSTPP